MYRPTTRVLAVLELLQTHGRMTGDELARRLEVHPRTARRYVEILQDLGIPVTGERGRYGAYRLRPGVKLPPLLFAEDEALALTLGLLAARRLGLASAAPAVEGALAKLERVLPPAVRERVDAVAATLKLDVGHASAQGAPAGAPPDGARSARAAPPPPAGEVVTALGEATRASRRVRLVYAGGGGRTHPAGRRPLRPRLPPGRLVRHRVLPPAARATPVPPRPHRHRHPSGGDLHPAGGLRSGARRAAGPGHDDPAGGAAGDRAAADLPGGRPGANLPAAGTLRRPRRARNRPGSSSGPAAPPWRARPPTWPASASPCGCSIPPPCATPCAATSPASSTPERRRRRPHPPPRASGCAPGGSCQPAVRAPLVGAGPAGAC